MPFLKRSQARKLVEKCLESDRRCSVQEILGAGFIPRLGGYAVQPGKVSDSIYGGRGIYIHKGTGKRIEFENPPLETREGVPIRIMVRTQRISTHDVNRGEIPFKDQVLAMNHNHMRKIVKYQIGTSQFDVEGLHDNSIVIAAENLKQIPFENVFRAYMAKSTTSTSLYQHYISGERTFCGHKLSEDLVPNGLLPYVMDTPSTKSDEHDESVSSETLFERNILTREQYGEIKRTSLEAFAMVSRFLRTKRLILVDTKTEHGINREGKIISQDELYTMDSSRFWLLDDYEKQRFKLARGEIEELNPKSYSKEFARGFSKDKDGYTDEQKIQIAVRYIEGIQHLLGSPFVPDTRSSEERIISGIETVLERLVA